MERNNNLEEGNNIQKWLSDFINQLTERLQKMEEILVVDRIENNIAVCENRKDGKMHNIELTNLPQNIKEGTILKWQNGKYKIDESNEIEKIMFGRWSEVVLKKVKVKLKQRLEKLKKKFIMVLKLRKKTWYLLWALKSVHLQILI